MLLFHSSLYPRDEKIKKKRKNKNVFGVRSMGKLSNRAENDTFLGTGSELGICRRGAWRISSSFTCHVTCFFYIFFSRYLFCLSPPSGRSSLFICDRHLMVSCNPHHSRTHRTLIINRAWWTRKNQKSQSPDR